MEANRYAPLTGLALRTSKIFGYTVNDIFKLDEDLINFLFPRIF